MKNICHNFYRTIIFNASALLYDKGKANDMFVLPRMQLMRLLVNQFVPGCFFILAAILGLCFVF